MLRRPLEQRAQRDHPRRPPGRARAAPHPLGPVAVEVLQSAGTRRPRRSEEKLQIALSEQRLLLERNLGFLGTMGNTAPLIGLLGTVWGIMRAFHDMARTGSAGPSVVAAGVAEALFTTAAGLLVAVPAVMLYNHFVAPHRRHADRGREPRAQRCGWRSRNAPAARRVAAAGGAART